MKFNVGDTVKVYVNLVGNTANGVPMLTKGDEGKVVEIVPTAIFPIMVEFKGHFKPIGFTEPELELVQASQSKSLSALHQLKDLYSDSVYKITDSLIYGQLEHTVSIGPTKCECGVDSIGGGNHSSYCPKSHIA